MERPGSQVEMKGHFFVDNDAGKIEKAVRISGVERTFLDYAP
jgi:hypothetical protein